jgi:gliding motility-associated-like protein
MLLRSGLLIFFILWCAMAFAQCTESSGVPIVNETFGAGTNQYGAELAAGTTNLKFAQNSACPLDGYYSIVNYTTGCFGLWQTVTDHTGDKGGYFMLIDASLEPSDFYKKTINGLCDGTTYEFSAYLLNMFAITGGTNPNITFTIEKPDGSILKSYNTGGVDITNPVSWKKFGFYFTTTPGITAVVLRMHNNAPGGTGNDLAIDDISFTPVGPKTAIAINGSQSDVYSNTCFTNDMNLTSTVGKCYLNNGYQWQVSTDKTTWNNIPSATASTYKFMPTADGTSYLRLNVFQQGNGANPNCGIYSNVITVIYHSYGLPSVMDTAATICPANPYKLPSGKYVDATGFYSDTLFGEGHCTSVITNLKLTVRDRPNLGPGKSICLGDSVILNPGKFSRYIWQDGSTRPTFAARFPGAYRVFVIDENGCQTTDSVSVKRGTCPATIIPPNVFSPNGDGVNDTWVIDGLQYFTNCKVSIFSRLSALIFKSTGYNQPWDGRYNGQNVPAGTYYYIISLGGTSLPISGYVVVLR